MITCYSFFPLVMDDQCHHGMPDRREWSGTVLSRELLASIVMIYWLCSVKSYTGKEFEVRLGNVLRFVCEKRYRVDEFR